MPGHKGEIAAESWDSYTKGAGLWWSGKQQARMLLRKQKPNPGLLCEFPASNLHGPQHVVMMVYLQKMPQFF